MVHKERTSGGNGKETFYASPERASNVLLEAQIEIACNHALTTAVLHSFLGAVVILNEHRQAIAANSTFLKFAGVEDPTTTLGLRPGEALSCIHVKDAPNGCGTGMACRDCGAVLAIVASQEKKESVVKECWLTRYSDGCEESVEFRLRASPIDLEGHTYTVITLSDIRDEKRFYALQRVFFHDIMNFLQGLESTCDILALEPASQSDGLIQKIQMISDNLVELTASQRDLLAMEQGDFSTKPRTIAISTLLQNVKSLMAFESTAKNKELVMWQAVPDAEIVVDDKLLIRVLVNMVKNALEASPQGAKVRLWYDVDEQYHVFNVWNKGHIQDDIARRIFQRYFTTRKGKGRGIGTYSMKLIGERYLGGLITFVTSKEAGTNFRFSLPR